MTSPRTKHESAGTRHVRQREEQRAKLDAKDRAAAPKAPKVKGLSTTDIDSHELLTRVQRDICKALKKVAKMNGEPFGMLKFAEVALRASGVDYAEASARSITSTMALTDASLRHAAVLYVYEALKACEIPIVKEWPEFDEMLRSLEYLARDLP